MSQWAKGNTNTDHQGPNLMVSRHGASANELQNCAGCRHLTADEAAPETGPWCCDQLVSPGGWPMPWCDENRACGLFEERTA